MALLASPQAPPLGSFLQLEKATTQRSTGMGRCPAQELRELNQLWGSGRTLTAPATTALRSCLPHFRFPSEAISGHKIYLFEKHHQLPFCLGIRTNCKPKSFGNPLAAYLVSLHRPSLCSLQGEQATKMGIPNRSKSCDVLTAPNRNYLRRWTRPTEILRTAVALVVDFQLGSAPSLS